MKSGIYPMNQVNARSSSLLLDPSTNIDSFAVGSQVDGLEHQKVD